MMKGKLSKLEPLLYRWGFDDLPNELIDDIVERLEIQDQVAASRLNARFHRAVEPFLYSAPLVCYSLPNTERSNAY